MKYRYKCEKCNHVIYIDQPMGNHTRQVLNKNHSETGCFHRILFKIIEKPNLNGVNRFGDRTRSPRDRRHKK